jgi:hypothetical protein
MTGNTIVQTKQVPLDGPSGPTVALMIAVQITEPASAADFVGTVAEQFKKQRMLAPPQTSMLLVSIVGALPAAIFAERWQALAQHDPILRVFMKKMLVADVVQGTSTGEELSRASLLT